MSRNGTPWCRCNRPLIDIRGVCSVCGLERLHIDAKVPVVPFSAVVVAPGDDGEVAA